MAAASAPPEPTAVHAKCGATTRTGGNCRRPAGAGTDHPGYGACKHHGGCTPTHVVRAAKLHAEALALEYQVEPHEALLRAVGQAAKWELVCRLKVAGLDDEQLIVQSRTEKTLERDVDPDDEDAAREGARQTVALTEVKTSTDARLNIWAATHVQAVRDLASIAKTAIDAGVEERRVRVAEALGGQLADVLGAIFNELELTADQRRQAAPVVRRHLVALEAGEAA